MRLFVKFSCQRGLFCTWINLVFLWMIYWQSFRFVWYSGLHYRTIELRVKQSKRGWDILLPNSLLNKYQNCIDKMISLIISIIKPVVRRQVVLLIHIVFHKLLTCIIRTSHKGRKYTWPAFYTVHCLGLDFQHMFRCNLLHIFVIAQNHLFVLSLLCHWLLRSLLLSTNTLWGPQPVSNNWKCPNVHYS